MIPLGDDNTARKTTPIVTYVLIALNIIVFFLEIIGGEDFILKWAFIPNRFLEHPFPNIITVFSSMFMHAGWGHLIGNMLYLWIFGDNVEDYFGKIKYIFFYILSGIAATFAQLMFNPQSSLPNVGASGAIAGILGAYLLLFPKSKVKVMVGQYLTEMSALVVIGFWFILQFFSGMASLYSTADTGGIAFMAHIGGFIAGLLMAVIFRTVGRSTPI